MNVECERARGQALFAVSTRVARCLGRSVSPQTALQIAMVCCMRQPNEVLEFLLDSRASTKITQKVNEAALSTLEWTTIVSTARCVGSGNDVDVGDVDGALRPCDGQVREALRCARRARAAVAVRK